MTSREIYQIARLASPDCIRLLARVVLDETQRMRDRIYAAVMILSWGIGKPKEHVLLEADRAEADAGRPPIVDEAGRVRAIVEILKEAGALGFATGAPANPEGDEIEDAEIVTEK